MPKLIDSRDGFPVFICEILAKNLSEIDISIIKSIIASTEIHAIEPKEEFNENALRSDGFEVCEPTKDKVEEFSINMDQCRITASNMIDVVMVQVRDGKMIVGLKRH